MGPPPGPNNAPFPPPPNPNGGRDSNFGSWFATPTSAVGGTPPSLNMHGGGNPIARLPEDLSSEELVTVSVDSTQLTTIVTALMKVMQGQSQCIETIDRDLRTFKGDTEVRMKELDQQQQTDFVAHQESTSALQQEIRATEGNLQGCIKTTSDLLSGECAAVDARLSEVRVGMESSMDTLANEVNDHLNRERQSSDDRFTQLREEQAYEMRQLRESQERCKQELQLEIQQIREQNALSESRMQDQFREIMHEFNNFRTNSSQTNTETESKISALRAAIDGQDGRLTTMSDQHYKSITELGGTTGSLQQELSAAQSELGQTRNELAALQEHVQTEVRNSLAGLHSYAEELFNRATTQKNAQDEFQVQQELLNTNLTRSLGEIDILRKDLAHTHQSMEGMGRDCDESKLQISHLFKDIEAIYGVWGLNKISTVQAMEMGKEVDHVIHSSSVILKLTNDFRERLEGMKAAIESTKSEATRQALAVERKTSEDLSGLHDSLAQRIQSESENVARSLVNVHESTAALKRDLDVTTINLQSTAEYIDKKADREHLMQLQTIVQQATDKLRAVDSLASEVKEAATKQELLGLQHQVAQHSDRLASLPAQNTGAPSAPASAAPSHFGAHSGIAGLVPPPAALPVTSTPALPVVQPTPMAEPPIQDKPTVQTPGYGHGHGAAAHPSVQNVQWSEPPGAQQATTPQWGRSGSLPGVPTNPGVQQGRSATPPISRPGIRQPTNSADGRQPQALDYNTFTSQRQRYQGFPTSPGRVNNQFAQGANPALVNANQRP